MAKASRQETAPLLAGALEAVSRQGQAVLPRGKVWVEPLGAEDPVGYLAGDATPRARISNIADWIGCQKVRDAA
jgi:hypothetical protein